ncbi:MAG: cell division protein SepF [Clostridia bacterium]|nr:cell division protein SepF [Clostridia bacterium]MDD4376403.1 cell division protein SepF [Clostridia bacterium]
MSAAILNKFLEVLGISEEEDEEVYTENEYNEMEEIYEKPLRAGHFSRAEQRKEKVYDEEYSKSKLNTKILPMTGTVSTSKVVITQPEVYESVEEIGEYLKQRKSVIVNLESINKEEGRRILDFLSGTSFALEGSIQKVSNLIYLITPKTVEIQNDVERSQYRSKLSFSWLK